MIGSEKCILGNPGGVTFVGVSVWDYWGNDYSLIQRTPHLFLSCENGVPRYPCVAKKTKCRFFGDRAHFWVFLAAVWADVAVKIAEIEPRTLTYCKTLVIIEAGV